MTHIQPTMALLSHYTSRDGLEGFAKSKCIRATLFSQLNDKREIEYGYVEFHKRGFLAMFDEFDKVMPRRRSAEIPLDETVKGFTEVFWQQFERQKASEPIFVASFARGRTADHDDRGMLTLWDRYTKLEGYCLQFHEEDVRKIIELETYNRHYAFLTLNKVQYGIDENTQNYRELLFQMKQLLLIEVLKGAPSMVPLEPAFNRMWPFQIFATRMLHYIAKHKDPFFEDEREVRIIGVPAKMGKANPLGAPLLTKRLKHHQDGRSYIGIGEDWRKLEPRRIIVGPRANKEISDVLALFDNQPQVINADFPIA